MDNSGAGKMGDMDMDGGGGEGGGGGGGDMMMMTMTFGKFTDYKVTIVWDWWKVTTVTQYFFSWLLVVLLVILLFIVKMPMLAMVEEKLRQLKSNTKEVNASDHNNPNDTSPTTAAAEEPLREKISTEGSRYSILDGHQSVDMRETILKRFPKSSSKSVWILRILHAFLQAVGYGLALLLMLIAMTYNVGLCIALVLGYFIGDLVFFNNTIRSTPVIGSAFTVNTLQAQECCSL